MLVFLCFVLRAATEMQILVLVEVEEHYYLLSLALHNNAAVIKDAKGHTEYRLQRKQIRRYRNINVAL